jgi:hypothetical protein
MGLFGKSGGTKSVRYVFTVQVHTLQPWPPGFGALAIEWERGAKRRGHTAAAAPGALPGQPFACYKFGAVFKVPCTLYQVSGLHLARAGWRTLARCNPGLRCGQRRPALRQHLCQACSCRLHWENLRACATRCPCQHHWPIGVAGSAA